MHIHSHTSPVCMHWGWGENVCVCVCVCACVYVFGVCVCVCVCLYICMIISTYVWWIYLHSKLLPPPTGETQWKCVSALWWKVREYIIVHTYICPSIYLSICMCIYIHTRVHMYKSICTCVSALMRKVREYRHTDRQTDTYIYIYIYICIHIYIYIYIYI